MIAAQRDDILSYSLHLWYLCSATGPPYRGQFRPPSPVPSSLAMFQGNVNYACSLHEALAAALGLGTFQRADLSANCTPSTVTDAKDPERKNSIPRSSRELSLEIGSKR